MHICYIGYEIESNGIPFDWVVREALSEELAFEKIKILDGGNRKAEV